MNARLDGTAVAALEAIYRRGEIRVPRTVPLVAKAAASISNVPASVAFQRPNDGGLDMDRT